MIFDYLGGPLAPPDGHVDDHVDEEQVGDEVEVEEEAVRLGELVMGGEGDELGEGGCEVEGHQDHRVQARDTAAQARPGNSSLSIQLTYLE